MSADPMTKKRGRPRGTTDPDTAYKMWLCWDLASTAKVDADWLPQHKAIKGRQGTGAVGGFVAVGECLTMSRHAVADYCGKARKRRDSEEGLQEYYDWLNKREISWWLYHALGVEKKELAETLLYRILCAEKRELADTVPVPTKFDAIHKDIESRLAEAKRRYGLCKGDYQAWFAKYEQRSSENQRFPQVWRPTPHAEAIAIDELRTAKGLPLSIKGRGRRPRRDN